MVLLIAVAGGLLAGWGWARAHGQAYRAPAFRSLWLILFAFLPQLFIAFLPATRSLIPQWLASMGLMGSLVVFLAFAWINRRLPGMPVLLAGLILNLAVMAANGGWMPISPGAASRLLGDDVEKYMSFGARWGQKDVLLRVQDMRLGFLADRLLLPPWLPYQVAFSAGDVLIGVGVFWLLVSPNTNHTRPEAE